MKWSIGIVVTAIIVPVMAGPLGAQRLSFGLKGGANAAYLTSGSEASHVRIGAVVGGSFTIRLTPGLAIQPELLYSMKGDRETGTVGGTEVTLTDKFDYLEIPVLCKISFGTNVAPGIYIGPAFSRLITADAEMTAGGYTETIDMRDYLATTDLGLAVGAEVMLPAKVSIEVRYTRGLANIAKTVTVGGASLAAPEIRNATISVLLGYYNW